jgi:alkylation response protein AidB-like acyl-CoA dehydrogenase
MDLEFTAEQDQLRAAVRSVLARECPPSHLRALVEADDYGPVSVLWDRVVTLDWPALTVPSDNGGLGGDFVDLAILAEELGRVAAPGPLLPTASQFTPVVRELGTVAQRQQFLGAVATGCLTGTLALAEANWSLDGIEAAARPMGEGWTLEGQKRYVIEGGRSDEIAVVARDTDGRLGVWVLPGPAIVAKPVQALDRSRQLATLNLDGVVVSADRRLGPPGLDATRGLQRALHEATTALALEAVGTCQTIFDLALQYAKDRHQFGVPIGSFQAMKHKFANMTISLERARATCYFATATIAGDDERRDLAVAMAKAAVGECQQLLAQEGIQTLGGTGYTWEHDMHLYVKRAKTADALFGSARYHRGIVAELIGL